VKTPFPLAFLALAMACRKPPPYDGAFEVPVAAAVLQPELGSPWSEPVGYVANARGGQIVPLALKHGTFLTDDDFVSFLPSNELPTGGARVLDSVATWASPECADARQPGAPLDSDCRVTVFAGDSHNATMVEVPHVIRIEGGFPVEGWVDDEGEHIDGPTFDRDGDGDNAITADDVSFFDADGSGNAVTLGGLALERGWTTTEHWSVSFNGDGNWTVSGSRSGRQEHFARTGVGFIGDKRRVAFTINGEGSCGSDARGETVCDHFEFDTRSGVVEHDVGGTPLALLTSPDRSKLAMIVQDLAIDAPLIRIYHPDTGALDAPVPLPNDAVPNRISWGEDGARLFVADRGRTDAWSIDTANGNAITEIPLPFRTLDVANLDGEAGDLLFAVSDDGFTVYKVDLATGALADLNPYLPGDQGMEFDAPVNGIEAIPLRHLYTSYDDSGVRESGRSIAIALSSSRTVFMEETSGCLMPDQFGPRTYISGSYGTQADYQPNFDEDYGPVLAQNELNNRHVMVSTCAGTAKPENWTLRYDLSQLGWTVEGNRSGLQQNVAIEDQRYISDDGSVSFVVRAGGVPSFPGWEMSFTILDGVASVLGDPDGDGLPEWVLGNPADPVFFHYTVGPTTGDWKKVDDRAFVLGIGTGSDRVGRIDPQEADVDIAWQ
jgi:hypothetical protein